MSPLVFGILGQEADLARRTGLERHTLWAIGCGRYRPLMCQIEPLAKVLGVRPFVLRREIDKQVKHMLALTAY
jgi:hypothetical protein